MSKSDLDRGREIVARYRAAGGKLVGNIGALDENVASLVAEGIALGRRDADAQRAAASENSD